MAKKRDNRIDWRDQVPPRRPFLDLWVPGGTESDPDVVRVVDTRQPFSRVPRMVARRDPRKRGGGAQ